ncbi:MAG: hypothetical protein HYZ26_03630 [Chloroflexi bacterium]|nr:hypothetical protein [Chloroflexota bacterium]
MSISPDTRPLPRWRNSELTVLEAPLEWLRAFQQGWLAHYEQTGEMDWARYTRPFNRLAPSGPGIRLERSRILLVSSAGGYLKDSQTPFDTADPLGDYSLRLLPSETPLEQVAFAHAHYDHAVVDEDPQTLLPLDHLRQLQSEGFFKQLLPVTVSFMGHQPNALRTVKELVPAIIEAARSLKAHAALLVPAGDLCIQSAGLAARALQVNGVASVLVSWNLNLARPIAPPRLALVDSAAGQTLGAPGDAAAQRRALQAALTLLEQPAPLPLELLD